GHRGEARVHGGRLGVARRIDAVPSPVHKVGVGEGPVLEARGECRRVGALAVEAEPLVRRLEGVTRAARVAVLAGRWAPHAPAQFGAECREPEVKLGLLTRPTVGIGGHGRTGRGGGGGADWLRRGRGSGHGGGWGCRGSGGRGRGGGRGRARSGAPPSVLAAGS